MPATPAPGTATPDNNTSALGAAFDAARHAAVLVEITSFSLLEFRGPDAATFLHNQLSSDVKGLSETACQLTSYNSPKGRVLANFVLWRHADEVFRALVPSDLAGALAKRLTMFVLRSKVAIVDATTGTAILGIGGPTAPALVAETLGVTVSSSAVQRTDSVTMLGLTGQLIIAVGPSSDVERLKAKLLGRGLAAPEAIWHWLNVRAGLPVITMPTQELFVAQMLNWELLGGVNFQKGCYPGQEIVARTRYLGRLKERTFAFHTGSDAAVAGTRLYSPVFGDQPCGTVVNVAPAPDGGIDLLAVVQIAAADAGNLCAGAPDGPLLVRQSLPYALPEPNPPGGH